MAASKKSSLYTPILDQVVGLVTEMPINKGVPHRESCYYAKGAPGFGRFIAGRRARCISAVKNFLPEFREGVIY